MKKTSSQVNKQNLQIDLDKTALLKILENSYDEIFVIDGNGTVIYVNKACEDHYGLDQTEIIGKSVWWFHEQGYTLPTTLIALRDKRRVTLESDTNTGKRIVVTSTPVFDNDGNIEMVVANARDITHLGIIKKNYEETKLLLKKYQQEVFELRKTTMVDPNIVANSKPMSNVIELAQTVAPIDSTILITGESGTGKNLIAKYIHDMSNRKLNSFIAINCAALPESLFESELFGYEPGAFTGASKSGKLGLLELANQGTIFFDEIAEIPLKLQAKLLEVVQERKFLNIGGREKKKVDLRIIAATNRKLQNLVKQGLFREDLYYRLNVVDIEMPSLRERPEDILPLIIFFSSKFSKTYGVDHKFSSASLELLLKYHWPGNVRELEHRIERLFITIPKTQIEPEDLPYEIRQLGNKEHGLVFDNLVPLDSAIEQVEKTLITKAYNLLGSSYRVAQELNISQTKAYRLIRKYLPEIQKIN